MFAAGIYRWNLNRLRHSRTHGTFHFISTRFILDAARRMDCFRGGGHFTLADIHSSLANVRGHWFSLADGAAGSATSGTRRRIHPRLGHFQPGGFKSLRFGFRI